MDRAESNQKETTDKVFAAVCGLYCKACSLYIGTHEEPERLKKLASRMQITEEELKCDGCRSNRRTLYCEQCKMFACAKEKEVEFCVECGDFPCGLIQSFKSEMPHRSDLWEDLDEIKNKGCVEWLETVKNKYTCPECGTINSAYDIKCRKCEYDPSCSFVEKHKDKILDRLKSN